MTSYPEYGLDNAEQSAKNIVTYLSYFEDETRKLDPDTRYGAEDGIEEIEEHVNAIISVITRLRGFRTVYEYQDKRDNLA